MATKQFCKDADGLNSHLSLSGSYATLIGVGRKKTAVVVAVGHGSMGLFERLEQSGYWHEEKYAFAIGSIGG